MKTYAIFRQPKLAHAQVKGRNDIYLHEGRNFVLVVAALFVVGLFVLIGLSLLAS